MASFTPEFWLILGLTLVLGWVLGLMSRSGGKRWKRELAEERRAHEMARKDYEARLAAADARIAELERSRPATAYREDVDTREDLRRRDSAIDNLDLTDRRYEPVRPRRP